MHISGVLSLEFWLDLDICSSKETICSFFKKVTTEWTRSFLQMNQRVDFWTGCPSLIRLKICAIPQSDFSKSWNFTWSEKISSKLSDFTFADLFHIPSGCYRKNFRIDWELSGFVKLSLFKICFLLYNVQNPIFYLVVRNTIHFVDALSGDSRDQAKLGSILRNFPSLLLLLRIILILYRYSYIRRMF